MVGNAVLATDVDYSEVGGEKGMLMVTASGTSVKLKNPEVLGQEQAETLNEVNEALERFETLNEFNIPVEEENDI
jgi:hypothetical protein